MTASDSITWTWPADPPPGADDADTVWVAVDGACPFCGYNRRLGHYYLYYDVTGKVVVADLMGGDFVIDRLLETGRAQRIYPYYGGVTAIFSELDSEGTVDNG